MELLQQLFLGAVILVCVLVLTFLGAVLFFGGALVSLVFGGLGLQWLMNRVVVPAGEYTARYTAPVRRWVRLHPLPAVATVGVCGILTVAGYGLWYIYWSPGDEPDPVAVLQYEPPSIGHLTDARGEGFFRMATEYREPVRYDAIPEHVRDAFISAEDKDYWTHSGWNWSRTAVATWKAFTSKMFGYRPQGASAIPQQVARKLYPELVDMVHREKQDEPLVTGLPVRVLAAVKGQVFANRTARKWREIRYAVRMQSGLERYFRSVGTPDPHRAAKEAILGTYLNMVYFGHGVYGVDYAAHFFFHKDLQHLTVPEAALLASLLPAPNQYAQLGGNQTAMRARRDEILGRMAENGFLTPAQLTAATASPLGLNVQLAQTKTEAPAAVNIALLRELPDTGQTQGTLLQGRIAVQTTLRMDIQRIVNAAVRHGLYGDGTPTVGWVRRYPKADIPQIAAVVLGPRGEMLAVHGGEVRDATYRYNAHMQLNRALAPEQPGSTIKIVDNMAAMMVGFTPDTPVSDAPIAVCMRKDNAGNCIVRKAVGNYEEEASLVRPLREWSARSNNRAFMRLMRDMVGNTPPAIAEAAELRSRLHRPVDAGAAWMMKVAREMGVRSPLQPYISSVLGASEVTVLDMANVIRTACTGTQATPYLVSRVTDRAGKVLYRNDGDVKPFPATAEQLFYEQVILYGNVRLPKGTAHSLDTAEFGIEVIGKTGTSDDFRDAWFCGCSADGIAVAVHVGYDDNRPMPGEGLPIVQRASGGWVALPVFREIMSNSYGLGKPLGIPGKLPEAVKANVNAYRATAYPEPTK